MPVQFRYAISYDAAKGDGAACPYVKDGQSVRITAWNVQVKVLPSVNPKVQGGRGEESTDEQHQRRDSSKISGQKYVLFGNNCRGRRDGQDKILSFFVVCRGYLCLGSGFESRIAGFYKGKRR